MFVLDHKLKITCEHVIVQRVLSVFFLVKFEKNSIQQGTMIQLEVTYAIYQGLSKRRMSNEYVGRKIINVPGVNLRRNVAFARIPSLTSRVITCFEPAIESKTSI